MKKRRGFKIGRRVVRISRWVFRRSWISISLKLDPKKSVSKLVSWGRTFSKRARLLCSSRLGSGYMRVGEEDRLDRVPKGHSAIYVGQKDGVFHRVLVPVFYFNHPLFCELLREAEEEYGFCQQGGITIPCQFQDFEKVQTRIAAGYDRRFRRGSRNPEW